MKSCTSKHLMALALAGVASAAASSAGAAEVTLTGWAFDSGNPVAGNLYSGRAGGFKGTLTGAGAFDSKAFVTYCVELTESFSFSDKPIGTYDVIAGASYFGPEKAHALGQLVTFANADPTRVDSAEESTSFQLAVWNLVYDKDYSVSVAGSFDDRSAYAPYANLLLKGAAGVTQNLYSVSALQRKGSQDFLLAEKVPGRDAQIGGVPLPTTLWLLAAAVAALALRRVARR